MRLYARRKCGPPVSREVGWESKTEFCVTNLCVDSQVFTSNNKTSSTHTHHKATPVGEIHRQETFFNAEGVQNESRSAGFHQKTEMKYRHRWPTKTESAAAREQNCGQLFVSELKLHLCIA